ncbi:uncharacterized protein [Odocoileus virginianus]|uniref:Uncharacterized protein n=1 Tax=Odocoileus virginianus TaxID=9874 RepID=A0ABM4I5U7_ODOVR
MAAIILGQTGPASAAVVSQGSRQVALHLGAHAPELAGSAGGLDDQGLPGRIPPPHSTRAAQVRFPAQATGTATLTEVEADCPARGRERGPGGAPSLAQIHPRASPGARARGLRALRLRKPGEADRSALAANSSAVRQPSWACSVWPPRRRPPTRKLALLGRGGENAGGGEPASSAAPRQWQTSRRPRSSPGRDGYLTNRIKSSPPRRPPSQPESWRLRPPNCCRCRQPLPTSGGPTAPQRVSERGGGRGSLSAKCCSLVLRGGCSSSNSHSFRRLT